MTSNYAKRGAHAAYCDRCERFDDAMRIRNTRPHCSFCGFAVPLAKWVPGPQSNSPFLATLVYRIEKAARELR